MPEQEMPPAGTAAPAPADPGTGRTGEEEGQTFEKAFAELEEVVRRLESGEAGLEESLRLFERGVMLARFCARKLDEAEGKIEILLEDDHGELRLEPFDPMRREAAS